MAIGDIVQNDFESFVDKTTGAHVQRLTPKGLTCHLTGRGNQVRCTSPDGLALLYAGEYGGARELYVMNLRTGKAVQLTRGGQVNPYGATFVSNDAVLYVEDDVLWSMSIQVLLRTKVYACEEGWTIHEYTTSDDGRYLLLTLVKRGAVPFDVAQPDWSFFSLSSIAAPLTRIVLLDRQTSEKRVVLEENQWITGARLRPHDPSVILYCHDGPFDIIDARIWLVDSDGSNVRCCRSQPDGEIVGGEHWSADGSRIMFQVWKRGRGAKSAELCSIDADTLEEQAVMRTHPYAHAGNDSHDRWLVGDSAGLGIPLHLLDPTEPLKVPEGKELEDCVYLCDLEHGRELRLCHHGTSWLSAFGTTQDTHPHASISSDGSSVLFVSDRDGTPGIYRVDLARFLRERDSGAGPVELSDHDLPDVSWGFPATF